MAHDELDADCGTSPDVFVREPNGHGRSSYGGSPATQGRVQMNAMILSELEALDRSGGLTSRLAEKGALAVSSRDGTKMYLVDADLYRLLINTRDLLESRARQRQFAD